MESQLFGEFEDYNYVADDHDIVFGSQVISVDDF